MMSLRQMNELPHCKTITKGWGGFEYGVGEIFAYHQGEDGLHPLKVETVKLLGIDKDKCLSLHYHEKKTEYFIVVVGAFELYLEDPDSEESQTFLFKSGDRPIMVHPGMIHQMTGLEEKNILLEISTLDTAEDSFRLQKGD